MIELTRTQLDIANAIFDGAKTTNAITAAICCSKSLVFRALADIAKSLGIERTHRKPEHTIAAIMSMDSDCFTLRGTLYPDAIGWEDNIPVERPGIAWPDYSQHNLIFRSQP